MNRQVRRTPKDLYGQVLLPDEPSNDQSFTPDAADADDSLADEGPSADQSFARTCIVTVSLTVITGGVFLVELATGALDSSEKLIRFGANSPELIRHGDWWRLVAGMFLHASWQHIYGNVFALWVYGIVLEFLLGTRRFLVLVLAGGLAGELLSAVIGGYDLAVGMSAMCFSLIGALAAIYMRSYKATHVRISHSGEFFVFGVPWLATFFLPGVGVWAHVGGFVTGGVLMLCFMRGLSNIGKPSTATSVAAAGLSMMVIAGLAVAVSAAARGAR